MKNFTKGPSLYKAPLLILGLISLVIVVTFVAYYYLEEVNENDLRGRLLKETEEKQLERTRSLSDHISSDNDSVILRLEVLASKPPLQRGEFASDETIRLLEDAHADISRITLIHNVGIIDQNNIHVNNSLEESRHLAIGLDRSEQEYVIQTRNKLEPYISSAFISESDIFAIAVAVPITNEENSEYLGLVTAFFPVIEYFERYGNVLNIDTSSIIALDKKGKVIATFLPDTIGKDYFGEEVQEMWVPSQAGNDIFRNIISGKPGSGVFFANLDERLVTGYPVMLNNEQVMSVIISTPTVAIYSTVGDRMAASRLQVSILLGAISLAVIALVVLVLRWNTILDIKVGEKTAELRQANEQLLQHDKLQQEFINIAAHELRTPVQPILGVMDTYDINLLELKADEAEKEGKGQEEKVEVETRHLRLIGRNAARLARLSEDILDASKIESNALKLTIDKDVNLIKLITSSVEDAKSRVQDGNFEFVT